MDCVVGSAFSMEAEATFDNVVMVACGYKRFILISSKASTHNSVMRLTCFGVKFKLLKASSL